MYKCPHTIKNNNLITKIENSARPTEKQSVYQPVSKWINVLIKHGSVRTLCSIQMIKFKIRTMNKEDDERNI